MASVFGKEYSKAELLKKTGNLSQICGIKEYTFNTGRAKGVDAIDIDAGDLKFSVLPSRCLDIGQATYKGFPFGYLSNQACGLQLILWKIEEKVFWIAFTAVCYQHAV